MKAISFILIFSTFSLSIYADSQRADNLPDDDETINSYPNVHHGVYPWHPLGILPVHPAGRPQRQPTSRSPVRPISRPPWTSISRLPIYPASNSKNHPIREPSINSFSKPINYSPISGAPGQSISKSPVAHISRTPSHPIRKPAENFNSKPAGSHPISALPWYSISSPPWYPIGRPQKHPISRNPNRPINKPPQNSTSKNSNRSISSPPEHPISRPPANFTRKPTGYPMSALPWYSINIPPRYPIGRPLHHPISRSPNNHINRPTQNPISKSSNGSISSPPKYPISRPPANVTSKPTGYDPISGPPLYSISIPPRFPIGRSQNHHISRSPNNPISRLPRYPTSKSSNRSISRSAYPISRSPWYKSRPPIHPISRNPIPPINTPPLAPNINHLRHPMVGYPGYSSNKAPWCIVVSPTVDPISRDPSQPTNEPPLIPSSHPIDRYPIHPTNRIPISLLPSVQTHPKNEKPTILKDEKKEQLSSVKDVKRFQLIGPRSTKFGTLYPRTFYQVLVRPPLAEEKEVNIWMRLSNGPTCWFNSQIYNHRHLFYYKVNPQDDRGNCSILRRAPNMDTLIDFTYSLLTPPEGCFNLSVKFSNYTITINEENGKTSQKNETKRPDNTTEYTEEFCIMSDALSKYLQRRMKIEGVANKTITVNGLSNSDPGWKTFDPRLYSFNEYTGIIKSFVTAQSELKTLLHTEKHGEVTNKTKGMQSGVIGSEGTEENNGMQEPINSENGDSKNYSSREITDREFEQDSQGESSLSEFEQDESSRSSSEGGSESSSEGSSEGSSEEDYEEEEDKLNNEDNEGETRTKYETEDEDSKKTNEGLKQDDKEQGNEEDKEDKKTKTEEKEKNGKEQEKNEGEKNNVSGNNEDEKEEEEKNNVSGNNEDEKEDEEKDNESVNNEEERVEEEKENGSGNNEEGDEREEENGEEKDNEEGSEEESEEEDESEEEKDDNRTQRTEERESERKVRNVNALVEKQGNSKRQKLMQNNVEKNQQKIFAYQQGNEYPLFDVETIPNYAFHHNGKEHNLIAEFHGVNHGHNFHRRGQHIKYANLVMNDRSVIMKDDPNVAETKHQNCSRNVIQESSHNKTLTSDGKNSENFFSGNHPANQALRSKQNINEMKLGHNVKEGKVFSLAQHIRQIATDENTNKKTIKIKNDLEGSSQNEVIENKSDMTNNTGNRNKPGIEIISKIFHNSESENVHHLQNESLKKIEIQDSSENSLAFTDMKNKNLESLGNNSFPQLNKTEFEHVSHSNEFHYTYDSPRFASQTTNNSYSPKTRTDPKDETPSNNLRITESADDQIRVSNAPVDRNSSKLSGVNVLLNKLAKELPNASFFIVMNPYKQENISSLHLINKNMDTLEKVDGNFLPIWKEEDNISGLSEKRKSKVANDSFLDSVTLYGVKKNNENTGQNFVDPNFDSPIPADTNQNDVQENLKSAAKTSTALSNKSEKNGTFLVHQNGSKVTKANLDIIKTHHTSVKVNTGNVVVETNVETKQEPIPRIDNHERLSRMCCRQGVKFRKKIENEKQDVTKGKNTKSCSHIPKVLKRRISHNDPNLQKYCFRRFTKCCEI